MVLEGGCGPARRGNGRLAGNAAAGRLGRISCGYRFAGPSRRGDRSIQERAVRQPRRASSSSCARKKAPMANGHPSCWSRHRHTRHRTTPTAVRKSSRRCRCLRDSSPGVRDFVEQHHVEEEFVKRKRDRKRVDLVEDGIGDVRIQQDTDVYRAPKRRLQ